MLDDDRRLDLVAMLAPRPTAAGGAERTILQQDLDRQLGGMNHLFILAEPKNGA